MSRRILPYLSKINRNGIIPKQIIIHKPLQQQQQQTKMFAERNQLLQQERNQFLDNISSRLCQLNSTLEKEEGFRVRISIGTLVMGAMYMGLFSAWLKP